MKNKGKNKGKKMLITLMLLMTTCSAVLLTPPCEIYARTCSDMVMPMADVLVWRYKVVKGITYKRLYNRSTGNWVGDWIKC